MSIPHLADLPARTVLQLLKAYNWLSVEKIDGCNLRFGLDQQGFYTTRKTDPRVFRCVDDWPDMPWCNSFRAAHQALECFVEILVRTHGLTEIPEIQTEILYGRQPNTIQYSEAMSDMVVITGGWFDFAQQHNINLSRLDAEIFIKHARWTSRDGVELIKAADCRSWSVNVISLRSSSVASCNPRMRELAKLLEQREHFGITNAELADTRMNRTPEWVTKTQWRDPCTRQHIRTLRDNLREHVRSELVDFTHQACADYHQHRGEGQVFVVDSIVFKLVDQQMFGQANKFTHRVRYYLQGGARPARNSFLSRTANWPLDQRLARLELLRRRYLAHHDKLKFTFDPNHVITYAGELHERTLLVFAELRQRLIHGR